MDFTFELFAINRPISKAAAARH